MGIKKKWGHNFGEFKNPRDYDSDKSSSSASSCGYTSYESDEVADTRSYFVGYYRKPPKRENVELDEVSGLINEIKK